MHPKMIDPIFARRKFNVKTICATPNCGNDRMAGVSYCRPCINLKDAERRARRKATK